MKEFRKKKLQNILDVHGKIIVGVDFDDTIFPLNDEYFESCIKVRHLLKTLKGYGLITICLYTVADPQSLKYKVQLMREWGIAPDHVNESPLNLGENKPFFNILIDDKSSIEEPYQILDEILVEFKNK